jgi:hypothetical protein
MFERFSVIDLENARLGDATCLSDIAAPARINATIGGTVVLSVSNPLICKILRLVRFDQIFPIVPTVSQAYEFIEKASQ